jgi:sulfate permease, SulP family
MIAHIRHSYRPSDRLVTYEAEQAKLHALDSDAQAAPGLLVYRFGANLYYANSQAFEEEVLGLVDRADPKAAWFALDASAVGDIDFTAAEMLRKLIPALKERGVTFLVVGLEDAPRSELAASSLVDLIGKENFVAGLHDLVERCRNAD